MALLALLALFVTPTARSAQLRPSALAFFESGTGWNIYAFVQGNNGHLVSNHFDGTSWSWTDHGLPPGATKIYSPKAITYVDDAGRRRIYVFAISLDGHLVLLFHKGAGYDWEWANQGGPVLNFNTLSATTFRDDNGVRRIYAFSNAEPHDGPVYSPLMTRFWDGNNWNWANMDNWYAGTFTSGTFSEATNYIDTDGHRRMDVFSGNAPNGEVLRHSWVDGAWTVSNLHGKVSYRGSVVSYLDTSGNRKVDTYVYDNLANKISELHDGVWSDRGFPSALADIPQEYISAIAYADTGGFLHKDLFAVADGRLYLRAWFDDSWHAWTNLGRPNPSQSVNIHHAAAITYLDTRGGDRHIWVFVTGNNHLFSKFWNGTSWQWIDLGGL